MEPLFAIFSILSFSSYLHLISSSLHLIHCSYLIKIPYAITYLLLANSYWLTAIG
jgi:hypothetical protein